MNLYAGLNKPVGSVLVGNHRKITSRWLELSRIAADVKKHNAHLDSLRARSRDYASILQTSSQVPVNSLGSLLSTFHSPCLLWFADRSHPARTRASRVGGHTGNRIGRCLPRRPEHERLPPAPERGTDSLLSEVLWPRLTCLTLGYRYRRARLRKLM